MFIVVNIIYHFEKKVILTFITSVVNFAQIGFYEEFSNSLYVRSIFYLFIEMGNRTLLSWDLDHKKCITQKRLKKATPHKQESRARLFSKVLVKRQTFGNGFGSWGGKRPLFPIDVRRDRRTHGGQKIQSIIWRKWKNLRNSSLFL